MLNLNFWQERKICDKIHSCILTWDTGLVIDPKIKQVGGLSLYEQICCVKSMSYKYVLTTIKRISVMTLSRCFPSFFFLTKSQSWNKWSIFRQRSCFIVIELLQINLPSKRRCEFGCFLNVKKEGTLLYSKVTLWNSCLQSVPFLFVITLILFCRKVEYSILYQTLGGKR